VEVTIGQAVSVARDICFVAALLFGIFKIGLWAKPAIDFFVDAKVFMAQVRQHMSVTETNMATLLTNHLPHLESEIVKLSDRMSQMPTKEKTISIKVE
jgi:hypothetical protein